MLTTVANGRDVLRDNAACRRKRKRVTTRSTVQLHGATESRIINRTSVTACGNDVAREN